MVSELASQRAFLGVSALLFAASAAVTIVWCASMSAMGEILGKSGKHLLILSLSAFDRPTTDFHLGRLLCRPARTPETC
jgi:hypothetical protein